MPTLDTFCIEKTRDLAERGLRRVPVETRRDGVFVERDGRRLVAFADNDYLGLSQDPRVIAAAVDAARMYGAGAGASRLVAGESPLYAALEMRLARAKGAEAACVFGSGYLAAVGTIPALAGPGDLILADKWVHACLIDGIRLSGARFVRFPHNDVTACEALLHKHRATHRNCMIIVDHIYSMDGDLAPLGALAALAERHDAWLMADDAHGGVATCNLHPATILMGTLSKALGSYGGYVCGSRALIDYLKTAARGLIFTTALPPPVLGAAIAALDIIAEHPELAALPLARARQFTAALGLPPAQSAIVPVILGDPGRAVAASRALEEAGFFVPAIRPPTVPPGTARLRFAFSSRHTEAQVTEVAGALAGILS